MKAVILAGASARLIEETKGSPLFRCFVWVARSVGGPEPLSAGAARRLGASWNLQLKGYLPRHVRTDMQAIQRLMTPGDGTEEGREPRLRSLALVLPASPAPLRTARGAQRGGFPTRNSEGLTLDSSAPQMRHAAMVNPSCGAASPRTSRSDPIALGSRRTAGAARRARIPDGPPGTLARR